MAIAFSIAFTDHLYTATQEKSSSSTSTKQVKAGTPSLLTCTLTLGWARKWYTDMERLKPLSAAVVVVSEVVVVKTSKGWPLKQVAKIILNFSFLAVAVVLR